MFITEVSSLVHSYIGHISSNYERISTKLSATNPLSRLVLGEKILKYITPSLGKPTPTFLYRGYRWKL